MTPKRFPIKVEDALTELESDPGYRERLQEIERRKAANISAYQQAAAPLLADLAKAGFRAMNMQELRARPADHRKAVPILVRWLPEISHEPLKQDVVRTLAALGGGTDVASALVDEFVAAEDHSNTGLRWVIGDALHELADDRLFDRLVELIDNERYGKAREMLVVALGKLRDPRAVGILLDLLHHEQLAGHAVIALGKLRAAAARGRLEELLNHPKQWVRTEVRKALRRMDHPARRGS